jgi:hypothetical protein
MHSSAITGRPVVPYSRQVGFEGPTLGGYSHLFSQAGLQPVTRSLLDILGGTRPDQRFHGIRRDYAIGRGICK